jgi:hypothetical protein
MLQYNMNYFCNLLYFSNFKNFSIKVPEDGVNDAKTMLKQYKVIFLSAKCAFIGV